MTRPFPRLGFALALLLTLTTSGLLVRSYWVSDRYFATWGNPGGGAYAEHVVRLRTSPGAVSVIWSRFATALVHARVVTDVTLHRTTGPPNPPNIDFARTGRFHYWRFDHRHERGRIVERKAIVPLWPAALACAALAAVSPLRWAWAERGRRARDRRGLCVACGYDLRGAAHERCPECAEPVAAARV